MCQTVGAGLANHVSLGLRAQRGQRGCSTVVVQSDFIAKKIVDRLMLRLLACCSRFDDDFCLCSYSFEKLREYLICTFLITRNNGLAQGAKHGDALRTTRSLQRHEADQLYSIVQRT